MCMLSSYCFYYKNLNHGKYIEWNTKGKVWCVKVTWWINSPTLKFSNVCVQINGHSLCQDYVMGFLCLLSKKGKNYIQILMIFFSVNIDTWPRNMYIVICGQIICLADIFFCDVHQTSCSLCSTISNAAVSSTLSVLMFELNQLLWFYLYFKKANNMCLLLLVHRNRSHTKNILWGIIAACSCTSKCVHILNVPGCSV